MRLTSWLWGFMVLGLLGVITVTKAQDDVEDVDVDDMEEEVLDTEAEEDVEEEVKPPAIERAAYIKPVPRGNTYFTETFDSDDEFYDQWVLSEAKKEDAEEDIAKYDGRWSIEEPKENPLIGDLGLVLKSKAKHHAVSSRLKRPFEFKGKPFVVQYEVKFQNGQECGGAYMKLLTKDSKLSLTQFVDKTPYTIMFGPDKCGNDNKLHFIFRHKNPKTGESEEKHAKKPTAAIDGFFTDKKTHLYTLIVNPDNSFEIFVDLNLVNSGSLLEDFEPPVNPPKEIVDPDDKKPKDWDEREKIADPEAKKPEDWDEDEPEMITDADAEKPTGWLDDETELIPDPDAEKPSDWDEDMDGEWEAPMISNPACESVPGCGEWVPPQIKNPAYKGKWKAPMIDNPDYRGKWKPRKIDNPDYFEDLEPYKMLAIEAVGLELWSMSDDIYFDNFIITDSKDVADRWAADTWELKHMSEEAGSSAPGIIAGLLQAADERKWLYAVYAVVVLLPVVFCVSMFRKSGSQPDEDPAARRKKTDEPDEDNATDDAKQAADGSGDAIQEPADSKKKPSKSDLEAEDANEADGEDEGETSERRTSPRKRKTKPQKEQ